MAIKLFANLQIAISRTRPLSYERQQIVDNFIVYYSTVKRYVRPPTATQSRTAKRGSWYYVTDYSTYYVYYVVILRSL